MEKQEPQFKKTTKAQLQEFERQITDLQNSVQELHIIQKRALECIKVIDGNQNRANSIISEIYMWLKGSGPDTGLIGEIKTVSAVVSTLAKNQEAHSSGNVRERSGDVTPQDLDQLAKAQKEALSKHENTAEEHFISWPWIRDKILAPAVMLGLGYFFFNLAPKLLALVEGSKLP